MSDHRESSLLSQLSIDSYQRFFKISVMVYPFAALYLSRWVAAEERFGYLFLRGCIWLVLYGVERKSRNAQPFWLRVIALGYITAALAGNALLISAGGPDILTVLTHCSLILLGVLECAPAWSFFLGAVLLTLWRLISLAAGSSGSLVASGLPFSLGLSMFMAYRRGSSLRNLARLLTQQQLVNARLSHAVSLVDDCNALLRSRVQERETELKAARSSLTRAQADLVQSHQRQVKLQEGWLQAHRLETLERFGTGLSHSFSNAITSIWVGVERLREGQRSATFEAALDDIEEACDRSAEICRRMALTQAIAGTPERPFEVERQLRESLSLLQKSVNNKILLKIEGNFWVSGEPAILDQILWNVVLNACMASPQGEDIVITVARTSAETGVVRIQDRGIGIEPGIMPYIFEPFYTTRGPGQGHGLGLAIVKEGAERLGGHCSLDSQPGQGTTVSIELPVCPDQQREAPVKRMESPETPTHGLKVCLVEDQDTLRKLLVNHLRKHSHQLVVARCAEEVTLADDVQVLITDVTLPGMSGLELAHQWVGLNPGLKVVFMSGYPFEAGSVQLDPSCWVFVPKPFRLSELSEHLARLIEPAQA